MDLGSFERRTRGKEGGKLVKPGIENPRLNNFRYVVEEVGGYILRYTLHITDLRLFLYFTLTLSVLVVPVVPVPLNALCDLGRLLHLSLRPLRLYAK
jgi:hypothetical protein